MNANEPTMTTPQTQAWEVVSPAEARQPEGTVITFYSYKGGVGRTLALANTAALLAQWGYRVLCVDWDLEAPGLHLYYKPWLGQPLHPGLTELLQAYVDGRQPAWEEYVLQVQLPEGREPLSVLTAGAQDEGYIGRMQALEWKQLYDTHQLGQVLETLRQDWKSAFDFILIDSRTGITDIGGICTIQLPDILVLLFTANEQSLYGAIDVAQRADRLRNRLPFDRARLMVLPVATRFEGRFEYEIAQEWLQTFATALAPLYTSWLQKDVPIERMLHFTRIPYVPYWSFGERLPVIEQGTRDPEGMGFALENVAALLAQKLAFSEVLTRNREAFVAAARRGPLREPVPNAAQEALRQGEPLRVFVSCARRDSAFLQQLLTHLTILQRQGLITMWHDRSILPGEPWSQQIDLYLAEADVILLLVSADFLASDYVYQRELPRALARHAAGECQVIPILIRPVDWSATLLARLQALPSNGQAVTAWTNQDAAWVDVVQGLQRMLAVKQPSV